MSLKNIIVTEGVYDSLFIPNCVCCGGKYLSELQYEILRKRFPDFKISISFDNDDAGKTSMMDAIRKFGDKYSYFIWFDESTKYKDINDYVLATKNPNILSDKNKVEKMIYNSVMARLKMGY